MDPFSKSIRKYIVFDEFEAILLREEGMTRTSDYLSLGGNRDQQDSLEKRLEYLTALEQAKGFVYVGEKLWVQDFLVNQRFPRYDQWVLNTFEEVLRVKFNYVPNTDTSGFTNTDIEGLPTSIWRATIDPALVLMQFPEHRNCLVGSEMELNVYGLETGPSPAHLVKLFEFLHCLDYMIALYTEKISDESLSDTEIEGIHVEHPSAIMSWIIDFCSSYSQWDFWINHRRPF